MKNSLRVDTKTDMNTHINSAHPLFSLVKKLNIKAHYPARQTLPMLYLMLFLTLSLAAPFQALALTKITSSISNNPVLMNESVDLIISMDDNVSNNALDFSVLQTDFRVLGTSVSTNTSIVNGSATRETRFTTRLFPKSTGQFVIPSFEYKGVKSNPIQVEVVASNQQANNSNRKDIFIESKLSSDQVWLQQQVRYTVKLFIDIQVQMSSATLTEPVIDGAVVEQDGKDSEKDTIINGVRYRLVERHYNITPQRSGEFVINSPVFQAEVAEGRRSQFFRSQTKTISRTGDSTTLTVKPIPNNYIGHWLPSELVVLNDEIQPNQTEFKVGEPITRTMTLSAFNVNPEQLPELTAQYPNSVKTYPDQADLNTATRDNRIISQRVESTAIVPTQTGEITLPAVNINWWNTRTEQMETATIAERKLNIIANPELNQPNVSTPAQLNQTPPAATTKTETIIEYVNQPWHFNLLSWLLLALWSLTCAGWGFTIWRRTIKSTNAVTTEKNDFNAEKLEFSRLLKACKKSDRQLIQQQLPIWVKQISQKANITNMHQALNELNNIEIEQQIAAMQAAQFSIHTSHWQGKDLSQLLIQIRDSKLNQQSSKQPLTALNPL